MFQLSQSGPARMGLTRQRLGVSLLLNIGMAGVFAPILILEGGLEALGCWRVAKAVFVLSVAGGLFELFLYYGFIPRRLHRTFGTVPAIVITSLIYVLWHVGTQLPMESDPLAAPWKLFLVGVMCQSVFSVTGNLLEIWPLSLAVGVMLDFAVNIGAVETAIEASPWAVGSVAGMAAAGAALTGAARVRSRGKGVSGSPQVV